MIRQRGKTGKYHYQFIKDGKLYSGPCEGCTTKRKAEAYEKKIRDTVAGLTEQKTVRALVENYRDELTGGQRITLDGAFEAYLRKPSKRTASEHQTARNKTYWNDFRAFMAAHHPEIETLASVTQTHASEYLSLLRTSGAFDKTVFAVRGGREMTYTPANDRLSPRTLNARHKAIKAVFNRLAADVGLLSNPFDIPTLDNDSTSREAFSYEELELINKNMTMPYTKPIFVIGLCTGLTLGDICLLKWSEIDGNWITNKRRRKTGTALEIPILPPLANFLNEQHSLTSAGEYVCPELAEMYRQNPSGVNYRVREFLEGLGIQTSEKVEGRSRVVSTKAAHAMRHTFAYLAGVYNVPPPIVQGVLGHLTPAMTELYQRHARREQKEKFFRQMPNLLGISVSDTSALIEPERAELRRLADTLPVEDIKRLLATIRKQGVQDE